MSTQSTFYIDTDSFSSATTVYTNSNLTTVASDGFYSDGSIVREMSGGVLLPQVNCPSCPTPCGGNINVSGNNGIYYLQVNLGNDITSIGAIVVTFYVGNVPDGILATYNGINYNGLISPQFGWLQGDPDLVCYIGKLSMDCSLVASSPHTLNEYQYTGGVAVPLGTTTVETILSGQVVLTADGPGYAKMVIPKTTTEPSILDIKVVAACPSTFFSVDVSCPSELSSFNSSVVGVNSGAACSNTVEQTYYVLYINGNPSLFAIYDAVFSDPNGEFPLAAGFYKTDNIGDQWIQVDANGLVSNVGFCTPATEFTGCGVSTVNESGACSNASVSPISLYSDCTSLAIGCRIYYNSDYTMPVTAPYIFADGANWNVNGSGIIVALSAIQC